VIRDFKPEVLFFTGGYVGAPVALAGWRIPKVIYTPDIEPALTLRFISQLAQTALVTTEESCQFYRRGMKVIVTGYPIRPDLKAMARTEALKVFGLSPSLPVLLVMGGSRGARSINNALWAIVEEILEEAQVIHVTGELDWPEVEKVTQRLPTQTRKRYLAFDYLHTEIGAAFTVADLAVSRAGASTIGEYPAFGLPSILIPYPYAWRYQRTNAKYMQSKGAAVVLPDEDLGRLLLPTIRDLLGNQERLSRMGEAAKELAVPRAAYAIGEELTRIAEERRQSNG
jgi:UDP-N-acetylglucosamine--N-acetylmuramyl-(pentapeptide) pyrophosphoryl-undecaprenol N-acetylglucosamine transferase